MFMVNVRPGPGAGTTGQTRLSTDTAHTHQAYQIMAEWQSEGFTYMGSVCLVCYFIALCCMDWQYSMIWISTLCTVHIGAGIINMATSIANTTEPSCLFL